MHKVFKKDKVKDYFYKYLVYYLLFIYIKIIIYIMFFDIKEP